MANQFKTTPSNLIEDSYIPGNKPKLAHKMTTACPVCESGEDCNHCTEGMARCEECGGILDWSLTMDCPGFHVPAEVGKAVVEKRLDYLDGFWIDPRKPRVIPVPEPVLTRIGRFNGTEIYADTSMEPGTWKLVDITEKSLKGSL